MKKYLTEGIGTFFLVLTIGLAVLSRSPLASLAIGSVLMVLVYLGKHVSGAHYNPAITIALFLLGKLPSREIHPYILSQVVGAVLGSLAVYGVTGRTFGVSPGPEANLVGVLLVEFLFTFLLALVIFNVAVSKHTQGNGFYGLAIGFTITGTALVGGNISGGAYNPAVGLAPNLVDALLGSGSLGDVWIYCLAPVAGAALAVEVFKIQESEVE